MLLKDLQKLGFTKNLASVYLALYENGGEAKAGEIVHKTGLHRNIVYVSLDTLEQKTLISRTEKSGVAVFTILDPSRLMNELKEKEQLAHDIINELITIKKPNKQEIIVHEGQEEMKHIYTNMYKQMNNQDTMYLIGISPYFFEAMGEETIKKLVHLHRTNGFKMLAIGQPTSREEKEYVQAVNGLMEIKTLQKVTSETTETVILPGKVLTFEYTAPYTVVEIINPDIVKNYINYFNFLWTQTTITYNGWEEIDNLFNQTILADMHTGDIGYVFCAGYGESGADEKVDNLFWKHNKKIIESGIEKQVIFFEKHREHFKTQIEELGDPKFKLVKTKFLPDEYYSPIETHIYKDKVVIAYFGTNPTATLYINSEIAKGFKKQFDFLWSVAKD
ncbi:MAG: helix-turn-helix domain-containing protein [bacterium]|nr:helix-turn-helix domain-containing protein [bacterium]